MISIKTPREIEIMAQGGEFLALILQQLSREVKPGVSTGQIEELAQKLIVEYGVLPSFSRAVSEGGGGFPAATCISINEEVVHGIPGQRMIKDGDLVKVDTGIIYKGFHADAAVTVAAGQVSLDNQRLLRVTKKALKRAIKKIRPGNTIGDVGNTIERYVTDQGMYVVRDLCGHGIGKSLHEDPQILNFGKRHKGAAMKEGMTFCVEPMVTPGDPRIAKSDNGWTYYIKDGSMVAHFEHTLAVTANGCRVLTQISDDDDPE